MVMEESERLNEGEGVSGGGRKGSWVRGRYMHGSACQNAWR